jgi:hypothetical protein
LRGYKGNGEMLKERKPNAKIDITKFIDKICTKKHKKSGQTTEETPG